MIKNSYKALNGKIGGSETSILVNFISFLLSLVVTWICYALGDRHPVELFFVLMVSLLISTVFVEWLIYPNTCAIAQWKIHRTLSWKRVGFREVALLITLAIIALAYWTLPLFHDKSTDRWYYPFLSLLMPIIIFGSVPYFCIMDKIDPEADDVYCKIGRSIVTLRKCVEKFELANYVRSWLVKAFWLSLMQPLAIEKIRIYMYYHWDKLSDPMQVFLIASTTCYAIDLCYASVGYALNLKLINTHTRTAEPTLLGWFVAAMCYWPFWGILFYPYIFPYQAKVQWEGVFSTGSAMWWVWASLIVAMELLYALGSMAAGIRFSNLTYRGLWNTGPYKLTKHPAYVFKSISWWLISMPFIVNSGQMAIKCTLMLIGLNVIYYLRAKTEERHLSHYPEYVSYAMQMNDKSIFRWCAKLLPFLKYKPPTERSFEVED